MDSIAISIKNFINLGVNGEEGIILMLVYHKNYSGLKQWLLKSPNFRHHVGQLYSKKLISLDSILNIVSYSPTLKALSVLEPEALNAKWEEFKLIYPKSIGNRRLHDKVADCRRKYLNYIQLGTTHEDIIKGTQNMLKAKAEADKMGEFFPVYKNMSTYLNNSSWEEYLDWTPSTKVMDKTRLL